MIVAPENPMDNEKYRGNFDKVMDSGKRQEFFTGSRRDTQDGKGRFDLIPVEPMFRVAKHYENGSTKYGDWNWVKGQPLSRYLNSLERHLMKIKRGDMDEDHEAAVIWNMMSYMETKRLIAKGLLPKELDDQFNEEEYLKPEVPTLDVTDLVNSMRKGL